MEERTSILQTKRMLEYGIEFRRMNLETPFFVRQQGQQADEVFIPEFWSAPCRDQESLSPFEENVLAELGALISYPAKKDTHKRQKALSFLLAKAVAEERSVALIGTEASEMMAARASYTSLRKRERVSRYDRIRIRANLHIRLGYVFFLSQMLLLMGKHDKEVNSFEKVLLHLGYSNPKNLRARYFQPLRSIMHICFLVAENGWPKSPNDITNLSYDAEMMRLTLMPRFKPATVVEESTKVSCLEMVDLPFEKASSVRFSSV